MTIQSIIITLFLYHIIFGKKMTYIKDFLKAPIYFKSIITTVLILIPFWICIICYYYPSVIKLDTTKILLIVSVPSIIYYVLNIFYLKLFFEIVGENDSVIKWVLSSFTLILELAILMLIGYYFIDNIITFYLLSLGLQIWRILYFGIFVFIKNRNKG